MVGNKHGARNNVDLTVIGDFGSGELGYTNCNKQILTDDNRCVRTLTYNEETIKVNIQKVNQ